VAPRIYDRLSQKTAIEFADYVLEGLPFLVQVIQTDNGAEFQSSFRWHVLDSGIGHVYIKPRRPRLNGLPRCSNKVSALRIIALSASSSAMHAG
jgi:hypothetical protein